jgi:hypothetical protein
MARPQTEFIQVQSLPWRSGALGGARAALEAKTLSQDAQSGATSAFVRVPAGWSGEGALATDEEWFVLDGDLQVDEATLGYCGYAHLPAGSANRLASRSGAIALCFHDARPEPAPAAAFDPARRVVLDALAVPYTGNFHPEFPPGAGRKWLFRDPQGLDETWLLGTMPLRHAERQEVHPVVEEMFLLAGEAHGDRGVMRPGAYFWRPPRIAHGPFGTRTGNLYFFRTVGGPLSTEYVDSAHRFAWDPPYRPVLPPGLDARETAALTDWRSA